ncbi:MAG TPA: uroporphyrinogen decarboxylase family protein [bacterium]|nr:uroporphyrinogen decarboxylase family protein [bacterium]HPN33131.1 uroporphyrinogen decarboxylase family protein [bacterium]
MTSRERILSAIRHQEPDRVPIDIGATPSSGISAMAYNRLKARMGFVHHPAFIYDVVQQLAQPDEAFLDHFQIDAIDIGRTFNTQEQDWYATTLNDGSAARYPIWFRPVKQPDGSWIAQNADGQAIALMPSGMNFFDQTCFPYLNGYPTDFKKLPAAMAKVHWSALAHSPWDHSGEADFWKQLRSRAQALRRQSDRALVIVCGCNLFEWGTFLRRIDNFLADLVLDSGHVEKLLDALMEIHLATLAQVCAAVGDVADVIRFGDDLGSDTGPLMSPELYRRYFKPRHRILTDYVKKNSTMHTLLHSCGSIFSLLPDLIEAGFEIINPVQTSSRNMEPEQLKKQFGSELCFWGGGCDTRMVLNRGSVRQVKEHVKKRMEIFHKGGGFVFTPVHNILSDVPAENILAMFQAVQDFYA